jgi:hypothetical protein
MVQDQLFLTGLRWVVALLKGGGDLNREDTSSRGRPSPVSRVLAGTSKRKGRLDDGAMHGLNGAQPPKGASGCYSNVYFELSKQYEIGDVQILRNRHKRFYSMAAFQSHITSAWELAPPQTRCSGLVRLSPDHPSESVGTTARDAGTGLL